MGVKPHKHEFTALYWHFGPFGPQPVHVHSCLDEDCDRVVIGKGRSCDGTEDSHWRYTLPVEDVQRFGRLQNTRSRNASAAVGRSAR